ncbi:hypothetical protein KGF56_003265 [Candida oxycetoniae]|uniref:Protein FMP25, mitochondrial n=1 Tax=Candida oxycetoniae TaxID=497107 RepID=A0AAI9WXJ7_9ASCO|nr:uncharacterized protein KGF56_003265 [Candida oxycetoniae]KAI3403835.2 hypothetical protein KGF56_003265 [Candida oxycetoniae]
MLTKIGRSRLYLLGRSTANVTYFQRFKSTGDDKFSNIEDFNKLKTEYNFGYNFNSLTDSATGTKLDSQKDTEVNPETGDRDRDRDTLDINAILEQDPRLAQLRPGSHEYRETLYRLHQEYVANQKKSQKKHEFNERMKGVLFGAIALVGLISGHQIYMNYGSLKNRLLKDYYYGDLEDNVENTSTTNVKTSKYLAAKLEKELSDENLTNLKNSMEVPGVYMFGDNTKIPLRVSGFDNIFLRDALVERGCIVAVTDKGKVLKWKKGDDANKVFEIELPEKVKKVVGTRDFYFFLTEKGGILYTAKNEQVGFLPMLKKSRWFGLLRGHECSKLNATNIKELSAGANHLLLLDKFGQISVVNTAHKPENHGQFGPSYSPFDNEKTPPVDEVIDLPLLNNEIAKTSDGGKVIKSRTFTAIASGDYFNIVSDSTGDVWAWGDNSFGQCGMLNTTQYQPVPKRIFQKSDFKRICRNVLGTKTKEELFNVEDIFATKDASFIVLNYLDQDVILSLGNGLNGQLGGGRYMQVCSYPEIIKSLTGLQEFDETQNRVKKIGIKKLSAGNNHLFVTLDNSGDSKDVMAFGSNDYGQLGNGKKIKTCKPTKLPGLLEPPTDNQDKSKLAKSINDTSSKRLQLLDSQTVGRKTVEQVIVAGDDASLIYYKCK